MKIGRNDPCPCGSGKKYKKCCGADPGDSVDFSLPEECRTGTLLDEYQMLLPAVSLYYEKIVQFDSEGKQLAKAAADFVNTFRPGTPEGVPDSMFLPWLHFDLRFGRSGMTLCERFLESSTIRKLLEPGPTLLRHMADSYSAFHHVFKVEKDWMLFRELGTGKEWRVRRVAEPFRLETQKGAVWYVRLVGIPEEAYIFSAPYVFHPQARRGIEKAVKEQMDELREKLDQDLPAEVLFSEMCKMLVPFWAGYFTEESGWEGAEPDREASSGAVLPQMLNTDGEPLRFCKVYFSLLQREGLKEKLSSIKSFDYDDRAGVWTWFKKGNRKVSSLPTTVLGTLSLKRKYLIGETNSEERALKLATKLKKELEGFVSFEKMEAKDLDSLPPVSEKKRQKMEKEQQELYANPEVRELVRQQMEDYYHKDWMVHGIPALGGKTPLEAVKTAAGRRKVEELLDDLDRFQDTRPDDLGRVDVDGLRARLGIPRKGKGQQG